MIYPKNFEEKIQFDEIRRSLAHHCLSSLGQEEVEGIGFSTDVTEINRQLQAVNELQKLIITYPDFPLNNFFDLREVLQRLRLEGTHAAEKELFDMRRSLQSAIDITAYLLKKESDDQLLFPTLAAIIDSLLDDMSHLQFVNPIISIARDIEKILDDNGMIKDNASQQLAEIRDEKRRCEKSIARKLYSILSEAQNEGLIDKDVSPTMRDSRLVLPIAPSLKRRIPGIVHDESASGRTVYVEPTAVVEANNRIRELEAEERREIVRILTEAANNIRPHIEVLTIVYRLLAKIDCIYAKTRLAEQINATTPRVERKQHIDWISARHPLLEASLRRQEKRQVPLDIMLTAKNRMLIISGPNAGGKSVCLKTVGLLQYMVQCGLPIPVDERSTVGIFRNIMLDMGDEQSIDDDLSTYSSHLINMKQMVKSADKQSLLLIDEFGGGTEPAIGGAIAEALLNQFWQQKAWGVITTHYQNLKQFADNHDGIVNGAMLYDRHEMHPLFSLEIGRPGSSFAIEIAKKIGLPREVIDEATNIVGAELISSDKYLQDIVRDKRYWENKRQTIHKREKDIEKTISRYESEVSSLESSRKDILRRAKEQAEELLKETNRRIENTIREIREQQAERENTRRLREELETFKAEISDIDTRQTDAQIEKKIKQIQERRQRKEQRRKAKLSNSALQTSNTTQHSKQEAAESNAKQQVSTVKAQLHVGDLVRIKGLTSIGSIEKIDGEMCSVIFGGMRSKMRLERLEHAANNHSGSKPSETTNANQRQTETFVPHFSRSTRETIDHHRNHFKQEIDVRGMRGDEAINAVMHYIDDAVLVGVPQVRILHGTGNGILRQLIRQYLNTLPHIESVRDEHVQFGGAGISVVRLAL